MKSYKNIFVLISALLLSGCNSVNVHFARQNHWTLNREKVEVTDSINKLAFIFKLKGDKKVTNISNNSDSLNFIASYKDFKYYKCNKYIKDVLKVVPTKIDSIYYVLGDRFIVFAGNGNNEKWKPDVIVNHQGGFYGTEEMRINAQDEENELWRNVIACHKDRRLICVDRFYIRNRYIGIIYIIQADRKKSPYWGTCHWNVNNPSYIELVAMILSHYKQVSINIWNKNN